jgi:hypothetical protein
MRVLVAVPWRAQPDRVYAHDLTVQRYREILPDAHIVDVDTDHTPFCLAACRNNGVRRADEHGADVVVLADADTLPEREPLLEAIEQARYSRFVHLPYTEYRSLRATGTGQHRAGKPLQECDHLTVDGACSGVYVTTPATWWSHGGQDELFRGWAPEDAAWMCAHKTLLGAEPVRHEGRVYALHHNSPVKNGPDFEAGYARIYRYHQAQGNPAAMRALIAEQPQRRDLRQVSIRHRRVSGGPGYWPTSLIGT